MAMTGATNAAVILLRIRIVPKFIALGGMVVYYNGKALRFEIYWGWGRAVGSVGQEFVLGRGGKMMTNCRLHTRQKTN